MCGHRNRTLPISARARMTLEMLANLKRGCRQRAFLKQLKHHIEGGASRHQPKKIPVQSANRYLYKPTDNVLLLIQRLAAPSSETLCTTTRCCGKVPIHYKIFAQT